MSAPSRSLKELFLAALDIAPGERAHWLERECVGDASLRKQLDLMLAAHDAPQSLLDQQPPAAAFAPSITEPALHEKPGTQIGPYKLLEKIGEGGFGIVFLAEQTQPVRRKVALKILKPGMDTRQVVARFEAERQALAIMDNPNIARVFDGGATATGRPYFVMELVKGSPITTYCDENHLTPRQRLELFVPVCQAIQHAHQKGIIHRDLKPSNVLVTVHDTTPIVKVIDFGVAKALGQELTEKTLFTGLAQMIGTPLYMSPEQAGRSDLDIDTRSDIYSLGVMLYELLTGTTPLSKERFQRAAYDEIRRIIREEEPQKPSTRLSDLSSRHAPRAVAPATSLASISAVRKTEPHKLSQLLRGELDWIVMKALEKDRNRRYETANSFAQDIQRYLADEPVLACSPSASYRLRKFVRRNKSGLAVGALVLFFVVLLGSGAGWVWRDRSAREAEEARQKEQREAQAARQQGERRAKVAGEVETIFAEVDRLEQEQKWTEALEAVRRAEAAVAGGEADAATEARVNQRRKDLEFIDRLEQIRMEFATHVDRESEITSNGLEKASGVTDQEYGRAFREYGVDVDELPAETSIDRLKARPELGVILAAGLDDWVFVRRRVLRDDWGPRRAAVSEASAARWQRLVGVARGIDPDPLRDQIRATWDQPVGKVHDELRRLADSLDVRVIHPATLVILTRGLTYHGRHIDVPVRMLQEAQQVHPGDFWLNLELGQLLYGNELTYQINNLTHQNKVDEGSIRFFTAAVAIRPRSARAHSSLGQVLLAKGRVDEAIAEWKKVIELAPRWSMAYQSLDNALQRKGDGDAAIAEWKKIVERVPQNAQSYFRLGLALKRKGNLEGACAEFRRATELDPKDAEAHGNLGIALLATGRVDEAIAESKKAIELELGSFEGYQNLDRALQKKVGGDAAVVELKQIVERAPRNFYGHTVLGAVLERRGDFEGAYAEYRKAIEIAPNGYVAWNLLYSSLERRGSVDIAIAEGKKVIELNLKDFQFQGYYRLGLVLERLGRVDEAIAEWRKVNEVQPNIIFGCYEIGRALRKTGRVDEAIAEYRKTVEKFPAASYAHVYLADALLAQGRLDEAIVPLNKAVELHPELTEQGETRSVMSGIAIGCAAQGRPADALRLIAQLLAKAGLKPNPQKDSITVTSCVQHFRKLGEVSSCRTAAATLEKKNPTDRDSLYNIACCWALTAAAQAQAGGPDVVRLVKEEADRAMDLLAKALAAGFSDVIRLRQDADLDSLRERDDFRTLLAYVEAKVPAVDLARSYIRLSQWDKAAAEYAKVKLWVRPQREDVVFANAGLHLIQGDSEGYDRFCREMLERVPQTEDHFEAFILARTCSMGRQSAIDPAQAVQWAKQAVAGDQLPWYFHALGLAQYRAGLFDEALQSFAKANAETWGSRDLNWFGMALARQRLGHPDEARQCLDKGIQWLKRNGPPGPGQPTNIHPMDWLEAHVLRREVEEVLKIKQSP